MGTGAKALSRTGMNPRKGVEGPLRVAGGSLGFVASPADGASQVGADAAIPRSLGIERESWTALGRLGGFPSQKRRSAGMS